MAEQEEEEGRKGGKRWLVALLAGVSAAVAGLAFWRRRRGPEQEE